MQLIIHGMFFVSVCLQETLNWFLHQQTVLIGTETRNGFQL